MLKQCASRPREDGARETGLSCFSLIESCRLELGANKGVGQDIW